MNIKIEKKKCTGCKLCIQSCPYNAIEIVEQIAILQQNCTGCQLCIDVCKSQAIQVALESIETIDLCGYRDVWVYIEMGETGIHKGSLELFECGHNLAKKNGENLCAVFLGSDISQRAKEVFAFGVDTIYLAEAKLLEVYQTNLYANTIAEMIQTYKPNTVLYSGTIQGRDVAPRIASRLHLGLTADCTHLAIDEDSKHLLQTRPAFGGNIMATIISPKTRPQMATVRPGVLPKPSIRSRGRGTNQSIISFPVSVREKDGKTKRIEWVRDWKQRVNLTDAKIVIGVGRGIKSKKNLALFDELKTILGAELGGSRVLVEEGWISTAQQIGQTGLSISPELYIACGLSGSIQHRAGILNAKTIVAINRDPEAPIFDVADYSIVGDIFEIIPALTNALKKEY